MADMKGITCCGDCIYYDWKKKRCKRCASIDTDPRAHFFADCPLPSVEPERPKGRWVLTAHEENFNYRWNVTAECSECSHSKGEVYAGFFPGFPKDLARYTILSCAESVKLDNFCPNCGADMRGESE